MNKNFPIVLMLCLVSVYAFAQHPSTFKYNLEKKQYSVSGEEKTAVKVHIKEWFKAHDTIGTLVKFITPVAFSPDYKTLPVCDSIGEAINYTKAKFKGFPDDNDGGFFGTDILLKNKKGEEERYTVDVSYSFQIVRIWFQDRTLYKAAPLNPPNRGK
ncbi:MAG TPA: hypothetical protein VK783_14450 [Bacteroidia bacterium]|jgi:hypothetical protein|nr:hypothetical protein [Bacteroidia bacterium]